MDHSQLDQAVSVLGERKEAWARLPVAEKIRYLYAMRQATGAVADGWVTAAVKAKGIGTAGPLAGEEWLSGPWALLFALNRLMASLEAVQQGHTPSLKRGAIHTRANGQVVVDVFPQTIFDKLLVNGVSAEVWMQPGVTPRNLPQTMATFYQQAAPRGKVALVLGAGNIASIPPLDVLYKLFAEGQVCILKMNPVNDYLGPFFEQIFAPLIRDGYVRIVYGGGDVGAYLCELPGIDEIHITGSARTHDVIVYGPGPEGVERKRRDEPLLHKRITSELGNVSPTIVVPGPWSDADLRFQSEHIATQKFHNGGFNCIAAQVLVLPTEWERTPALLDALRTTLRAIKAREPYYPGAEERYQAVLAEHPEAERLDPSQPGSVPRTLVTNVDPANGDDACFTVETFGGVLAQTSLPGKSAAEFLREAVHFCNETLHGTLGANLLIHPQTIKELGPVLDEAIADLRYGCVAINAWTGVGFLLAPATWGAFPGHTNSDIQSGVGVVHNTLLFDKPQKSVVRGPFYPFPRSFLHGILGILPKPPWFITNKQADKVGRGLVAFEQTPGWRHLPGIFFAALRG
ncbi:MAG: aldehyde dehydrogenase family protein [Herpetosiphonaceae bacterium]|nr:aldehyde dehydrogenase family protein [Herpetosiphonaceae bacterium]